MEQNVGVGESESSEIIAFLKGIDFSMVKDQQKGSSREQQVERIYHRKRVLLTV
jgi:hypothetical protein